MSLQAQKAFGKNMSLQRQLDGKYMEYKKSLRSTRRRMDSIEEECILSLYKLLLEAKMNRKVGDSDLIPTMTPGVPHGRSKDASLRPHSVMTAPSKGKVDVQERPYTSMSSRNYTQSYSFKKDGLDLSKFNKRSRTGDQSKADSSNRPMTASNPTTKLTGENGSTKVNWTRQENSDSLHNLRSQSAYAYRGGKEPLDTTQTPEFHLPKHEDQIHTNDGKTRPSTSILKHRKGSPVQVTVHEASTQLDEFRPLSVKISQTSPVHHPVYRDATPSPALNARTDTEYDEELLPFMDEVESEKFGRLVVDGANKTRNDRYISGMTSHHRNMAPSRTESEEFELMKAKSIQGHQKFLADYSKRSKLFGYVVKTKSSIISNEKAPKSGRSPCVTYQELVSIKSSMKQHETRTRMLLKRSANLSKYVDQLTMASDYRKHLQSLKTEKP